MIDKLREARDVMKDTEKYLSDILAHEWMAHHPHFHIHIHIHIHIYIDIDILHIQTHTHIHTHAH